VPVPSAVPRCAASTPSINRSSSSADRRSIPVPPSDRRAHFREALQCAKRWELIEKNPIKLVRVKGGTKRLKTPTVLAPGEFHSLLPLIREPYRTMVLVAGCLGLRVSEIVGLQWQDFDFAGRMLLIQRSVVHGRVGDVKTEYSQDSVPIDSALIEVLMLDKEPCLPTPEGWLFANPATEKPYHQKEIQKKAHSEGWCCSKHRRRYRLARVPPQLSVLARRHRRSHLPPKRS